MTERGRRGGSGGRRLCSCFSRRDVPRPPATIRCLPVVFAAGTALEHSALGAILLSGLRPGRPTEQPLFSALRSGIAIMPASSLGAPPGALFYRPCRAPKPPSWRRFSAASSPKGLLRGVVQRALSFALACPVEMRFAAQKASRNYRILRSELFSGHAFKPAPSHSAQSWRALVRPASALGRVLWTRLLRGSRVESLFLEPASDAASVLKALFREPSQIALFHAAGSARIPHPFGLFRGEGDLSPLLKHWCSHFQNTQHAIAADKRVRARSALPHTLAAEWHVRPERRAVSRVFVPSTIVKGLLP